MKNLIKLLINSNPCVEFETENDFGHIQFDEKNWSIFFNAKCVHVSKTFDSAFNKLVKLGIDETNIIFEE
jgi:hypothetical protein